MRGTTLHRTALVIVAVVLYGGYGGYGSSSNNGCISLDAYGCDE